MKRILTLIITLVMLSLAIGIVADEAAETSCPMYRIVPAANLFKFSAEEWWAFPQYRAMLAAWMAYDIDELLNPGTVDVLNTEASYLRSEGGYIELILPGTTCSFYVKYQPDGYAVVLAMESISVADAVEFYFGIDPSLYYENDYPEWISAAVDNVKQNIAQLGNRLNPISERSEFMQDVIVPLSASPKKPEPTGTPVPQNIVIEVSDKPAMRMLENAEIGMSENPVMRIPENLETGFHLFRINPLANAFHMSAEEWYFAPNSITTSEHALLAACFAYDIDELFNPGTQDVSIYQNSAVSKEGEVLEILITGTTSNYYVRYQPGGYADVFSLKKGFAFSDALDAFFRDGISEGFYLNYLSTYITDGVSDVNNAVNGLGDSLKPISMRAEYIGEVSEEEL